MPPDQAHRTKSKPHRYDESSFAAAPPSGRFAAAIRQTFAGRYGAADLKADVLAGLVVGIVALPLSMALGIASGVPPQHGLYTAFIAGDRKSVV